MISTTPARSVFRTVEKPSATKTKRHQDDQRLDHRAESDGVDERLDRHRHDQCQQGNHHRIDRRHPERAALADEHRAQADEGLDVRALGRAHRRQGCGRLGEDRVHRHAFVGDAQPMHHGAGGPSGGAPMAARHGDLDPAALRLQHRDHVGAAVGHRAQRHPGVGRIGVGHHFRQRALHQRRCQAGFGGEHEHEFRKGRRRRRRARGAGRWCREWRGRASPRGRRRGTQRARGPRRRRAGRGAAVPWCVRPPPAGPGSGAAKREDHDTRQIIRVSIIAN